ncbi:MAG: hypothetical protein EHM20_16120 [Alphaproteobacteria bacterium]|nr:MAG: hypothetical protein EHM20_16120 [Alphaproteobacteria bacterium]
MNKSNSLLVILFLLLTASCAGVKNKSLKSELIRGEERFSYTDKNGSFLVKLGSGFNKKDNTLFTKRSLEITNKETDNILEQSIVLSEIGVLKKKKTILRPKISQYTVWFDGKKYFSELKLNQAEKLFDLKMVSPEPQWNGVKKVKLPNSKALYCFFSQVIECAKAVDFITTAIKKEAGSMNFYIVWEGYPYLNETFSDFPVELFSKAKLEYDGKTKEDERRFNLSVAGQSIFFVLDKNEQMKKMFWVSQGISMVSRTAKKSTENKPDAGEDFE